jgi:hypothetical protein
MTIHLESLSIWIISQLNINTRLKVPALTNKKYNNNFNIYGSPAKLAFLR